MKAYQAERRRMMKEHHAGGHAVLVQACAECRADPGPVPERVPDPTHTTGIPVETILAKPVVDKGVSKYRKDDPRYWKALGEKDPRFWVDPGDQRPPTGPWSSGPPYFGRPVPRKPYVPTAQDRMQDEARAAYRASMGRIVEAVPNPKGRER
jgi:hypothetical protein